MAKIEDFIRNASNADWEQIAVERKIIKNNDDAKAFKDKYGFMPESIRSYEVMHFYEINKQQQNQQAIYAEYQKRMEALQNEMQNLKSENENLHSINKKQQAEINAHQTTETGFPSWRRIRGDSVRHTIYATQESVNLLSAAVDKAVEEYGFSKYIATAFILEEAIKRLHISTQKDEN